MNPTRENISKMKTNIQWKDPKVVVPPVERPFLAVIGGGGSYGGKAISYSYVSTVVINKDGPNDDGPYNALMFDNVPWEDLQFYVLTYEQHLTGEDPTIDCDLYSDTIMLWAHMPDLRFDGLPK